MIRHKKLIIKQLEDTLQVYILYIHSLQQRRERTFQYLPAAHGLSAADEHPHTRRARAIARQQLLPDLRKLQVFGALLSAPASLRVAEAYICESPKITQLLHTRRNSIKIIVHLEVCTNGPMACSFPIYGYKAHFRRPFIPLYSAISSSCLGWSCHSL